MLWSWTHAREYHIGECTVLMIHPTFEDWIESESFLRGHCLTHVKMDRWESFRHEFLDRYERAKKLHAEEARLSRMARLRAVFAPVDFS